MNDKYPNWLFIILQNDFGEDDEYWYDVDTNDAEFQEAYLKLRGLRRKYSDYNKWLNACAVYDEYIGAIIDHNGGDQIVESMFRSDITPEGWVPRPRLKNKKYNREILESGIRMSEVNVTIDDIHCINEIAQEELPLTDTIRESIPDVATKPKGAIKSALDKAMEASEVKHRVASMHTDRAKFDVLSTYYREVDTEDEETNMTISDMFDLAVSKMYESENDDGWRPSSEYDGSKKYLLLINNVRKQEELDALNVAVKMYEDNGIVIFDPDNMSRDKVSLYRSKFGVSFDPKARKKAEKNMKKYEKDLARKKRSEMDLARALVRNQDIELDLANDKFTLDYRKKYKK